MGVKERKARHRDSLRQMILDAAREMFVTEGYHNTSIRKIAEKIEYSPPVIYAHFRDKADLFDTLCEQTFAQLERELHTLQLQQRDPVECLRRGLRTYIEFGLQRPKDYEVTLILPPPEQYAKPGSGSKKELIGLRTFDNLRRMTARVLQARGVTDEQTIEEVSQSLWASIHGLTALLITQAGFPFVERQKLLDRHVELLVRGVTG